LTLTIRILAGRFALLAQFRKPLFEFRVVLLLTCRSLIVCLWFTPPLLGDWLRGGGLSFGILGG
jgi:hypothetical protein